MNVWGWAVAVTWSGCRFGKEARSWAMCQIHLIIYWVREAEQNWALEKLLPWNQTCKREGDAWKTFKDCGTRWRNEPKSVSGAKVWAAALREQV